MGITNLDKIITGSKRVESLHFGYADYAASVRMRTTNIGGTNPDYSILTDEINGERLVHWIDMWHYPLSKMTTIGRAHGLRIIDGPFGIFLILMVLRHMLEERQYSAVRVNGLFTQVKLTLLMKCLRFQKKKFKKHMIFLRR